MKLDSWGQISIKNKRTINLYKDVFSKDTTTPENFNERHHLVVEEMNYLVKKYIVEIEVVKGDSQTIYLRYVTLN